MKTLPNLLLFGLFLLAGCTLFGTEEGMTLHVLKQKYSVGDEVAARFVNGGTDVLIHDGECGGPLLLERRDAGAWTTVYPVPRACVEDLRLTRVGKGDAVTLRFITQEGTWSVSPGIHRAVLDIYNVDGTHGRTLLRSEAFELTE